MDKSSSRTSSLVIKRKRTQIHTVRNEREVIPTPQKYKGLVRNYYEQLYENKWTLQRKWINSYKCTISKTKSGRNTSYEHVPIISNEIEICHQKPPTNKSPGPDSSQKIFNQTYKEELTILLKLFQNCRGRNALNSSYKVSTTMW